jgi:hypothetical protein
MNLEQRNNGSKPKIDDQSWWPHHKIKQGASNVEQLAYVNILPLPNY